MAADLLTGRVETSEAIVIGGGVVGCAVLRELATRGIDTILLEAEPDIGEGASKANSAIIHTGFDARPGSIEAALLRRAAGRWPELLDELAVPFLVCGALMLARAAEEAGRLAEIAALAASHGVTTEIVDGAWLRDAAPYVTTDAVAALHVPDEGIVDPFWLTRAFAEAALALGSRVWTSARVASLAVEPEGVSVTLTDRRRVHARQAFDCAGLWADEVARLAGDTSFTLRPRKGQFLVSERTYDVDRIVLPIPGPLGKGMLVTPIVFGGVLLGPTAEDSDDKTDRATTHDGRVAILAACRSLVPDVAEMDPIRSFAGVRAVSSTGDYIIRPSTAGDRLTIVAGIRSTGISASPAIAAEAVDIAAAARGWTSGRSWRADRGMGLEIGAEAGPVVCVCRSVGAAEVDAALAGPLPATTTDGLKRRCGVGFGDCQGNRCLAAAIDRLATARGAQASAIEKGLAGSWLVAPGGDVRPIRRAAPPTGAGPATGVRHDVAIVGGGLAGIGAALAVAEAGLVVVVADRGPEPGGALATLAATWWTADERDALQRLAEHVARGSISWLAGATVVGLVPGDGHGDGWRLDVAGADEAATIVASHLVLATGGYITPREHLAIDGPRPSGVMTADFALDALDRGWQPARRVVVTGEGRLGRATAERLAEAGIDVVGPVAPRDGAVEGCAPGGADADGLAIEAVRGDRRLEAVRVGDRWIEADGLVLAHALRPATFLLRGLGIGDDRPGVAMPADDRGALPFEGLWAAGTCVEPAVDHERSLERGQAVGATVAAAVRTDTATASRT